MGVGASVVGALEGLAVGFAVDGFGLGAVANVGWKVCGGGVGSGLDDDDDDVEGEPSRVACSLLFCVLARTKEKTRPNTAIMSTPMRKQEQIAKVDGFVDPFRRVGVGAASSGFASVASSGGSSLPVSTSSGGSGSCR